MALNPSIISMNYLKNSGSIPSQNIEITFIANERVTIGSYKYYFKPAWIKIILTDVIFIEGDPSMIEKLIYKVTVDPVYANQLSIGYYQEQASIYYHSMIPGPNNNGAKLLYFNINLRVLETTPLSLSANNFTFNYNIGDPAPAGQFFTLFTSGNWSIAADQSFVNFSQVNGQGQTIITLNVDVTGLPSGLHTATFQVDDGNSQKNGTVNLIISGSGDVEDYLNVSPSIIEFSETYLEAATSEGSLKIDSSLPATIETDATWLLLSAASAAAGLSEITINTQNTELLQIGGYPAEIRVISNYTVRLISVFMQVVEITSTGIENNGFYFAEDRNTLKLTTGNINTEAVLNFITSGTLELKRYTREVPFYRNFASIIIGLETNLFLKPQAIPQVLDSQGFAPVKPIRIDFSVYDKSLENTSMVERTGYSNLQFLNGNTPKEVDVLTKLPKKITVPADGKISFSFKSAIAILEIKLTGSVNQNIEVDFQGAQINAAIIDLKPFNLVAGNSVTISCGPVTIQAIIKSTQTPTSQLIWLNEWDCPEIMNLTGNVLAVWEDDSTTAVSNRSGKDYTSIIETKKPKKYKLNTGNIYSELEVEFLADILSSKQMWLQFGTERVEVIKTFREIAISETRRSNMDFNLTFDSAIK